MKYESGEFIPLDYKNLYIDLVHEENPLKYSSGDFSVNYHVPEFTYWADMDSVSEAIGEWEFNNNNIPKEYEDKEFDYIDEHFEELVNKYKRDLMAYFEEDAVRVLSDLYLYERERNEAITDDKNYYPPNFKPAKGKSYAHYLEGYGGAFDIGDDQYFTRDDLIDFADEVLEHINETFNSVYDIGGVWFENGNVITQIVDKEGNEYEDITHVDMRRIRAPWHLNRAYALHVASNIIKQIDSIKEALSPADYSPKQTGIAYKVFKVKNGKLYPPMVSNKNNEPTPVGVWLDAEEGEFAGLSKPGRPQVKSIGSGNLSYRPGWHLGDIPRAKQFDRRNKETGEMEFPKDFVWAECEYAMDVDYQPESDARGYERTHIDDKGNVITTKSDKYQHSLAGLPKLPKDGYYKYRTNPNPDTVPWIITGQMKVNKLLSDDEVNEILKSKGVEPIHRQGGDKTLKELGL